MPHVALICANLVTQGVPPKAYTNIRRLLFCPLGSIARSFTIVDALNLNTPDTQERQMRRERMPHHLSVFLAAEVGDGTETGYAPPNVLV